MITLFRYFHFHDYCELYRMICAIGFFPRFVHLYKYVIAEILCSFYRFKDNKISNCLSILLMQSLIGSSIHPMHNSIRQHHNIQEAGNSTKY